MSEVPVWAEINLEAIAHNLREIRRVTSPKAEIMAVVKANAYGHGAVEVSRVALAQGASRLAVARATEGAVLRQAGIEAPILLLGFTPPAQLSLVLQEGLIQTIYSREMAEMLADEARKRGVVAPVHIKVDTGMGRIGFTSGPDAMAEVLAVASMSWLRIEGIFTHFASADARNKTYALGQYESFVEFIELLRRNGLEFPLHHCANSAAIIDLPETHLDLVRSGIITYGLFPSEEVDKTRIDLRPAMAFKAKVAHVKKVPAGFKVSYGCTYETPKPTVIATLPVGYADGYSRLLSSRGEVLLHGRRASVVGRVCMDQCMIDVGHIPEVHPGDEVLLFGVHGDGALPVEEVASKMGTINYEAVCMVSARVPRIYI